MIHALRQRLDPILANLKERLLQHAGIRKTISKWSGDFLAPPEREPQTSTNGRGDAVRPSSEARHIMQLYLVEHGIAVERSEGIPDEWRPLSDKGRRRFQKTARAFGKLGRKLDLILTSPLTRAVQTAEILAGETGPGEVAGLPELDPKFDIEAARSAIAARAGDAEAVAIVGHEPQISAVLAALCGVSHAEIGMEHGAIVRLDVETLTDGASADPRWWLKPKGSRKKGLPLRKQEEKPGLAADPAQPKRMSKKSRQGKVKASQAEPDDASREAVTSEDVRPRE
jgi:phosphohistidine phosphatase